MGTEGPAGKRTRWVAVFAVLLCAVSAAPVLAEAPDGPLIAPDDLPEGALPTGAQVAEGLREAEAQEAAEEAERETPAAAEEREASLQAFSDLTPADAKALLQTEFATLLERIDQDPARLLSDAQIEQVLSSGAARISLGGEKILIDGTVPVRAPDEEGELRKIDLDLLPGGEELEPVNPLAELVIPEEASEGVAVGDEGLTVAPTLTEGESTAHPLGDKDVFYPETQTDTDLVAMPMANGVELFSQLRSVESPERLRFAVTLPEGAELRSDGEGGAQVAREGDVLARVPAPSALDAQGAEVPVEMSVEGETLVLDVPHREMEIAYPVLVDPAIAEDWYNGKSWHSGGSLASLTNGTWIFQSNAWGRFWFYTSSPITGLAGGSEKGLFTKAGATGSTQTAERFGEWSYTVPGSSTYITVAGVNPFWRFNHGCSAASYPQPHDYVGFWSPYWSPSYGWVTWLKDRAIAENQAVVYPPSGWKEKTAQVLILGLGTGSSSSPPIPCDRHLYAGGVYVWMSDMENPSLGAVSGIPSGWVSDETPFTLSASASDAGLGVNYFTLTPGSAASIDSPPPQSRCSGLREKPCPAASNFQMTLDGDAFDEGESSAKLTVKDPLGQPAESPGWTMRVDRTPPKVTLSGQLATATDEQGSTEPPPAETEVEDLSLPAYNLKIEATDGSSAEAKTKRSGVKKIEVWLDGAKKETWEQSCPSSSCPMTKTYELKLAGLAAGFHKLKVEVFDHVGKMREREIEFEYIPATGMKDEYVMHYFPLPDGEGNEAEEEFPDRPELAVNVMNGNLVYREQDIEVEGYAVDLEVERYYNSQLPESENTEWGDGWTLAQTPDLELEETGGSAPPEEAELLDTSGAMEDGLELPTQIGEGEFDPALQATLTKEAGGYELVDETEPGDAIAFDEDGQTEELRSEGLAEVDYAYEAGVLSEIVVEDPGSATSPPAEAPQTSPTPMYDSSFGAFGSGNGQLKAPADAAVDVMGNVWVVDRQNNRVQKFNQAGEYVFKFGASGSGNGEFSSPSAIALDPAGNLWIADAGNSRVQKFNDKGEFLLKFGSFGTANGQFSSPEGIAADAEGNVWVADSSISRVQKFDAAGQFLSKFGSYGSGSGQLGQVSGIDIGPDGDVWVADWENNRISRFTPAGQHVKSFGSWGTDNGQFRQPATIDVDHAGNVWVGDEENGRIQRFNEAGEYVAEFGTNGSGVGQFSLTNPMGIATDYVGQLWITDVYNNRIQKWRLAAAPEEDDPAVELDASNGLVTSLDGEEAGEHDYAYAGNDLVSHSGPLGETEYQYDLSGRMIEVVLPNGTWATISYNQTYGRVSSVTVDPAGSEPAETTYFTYSTEPRRTTVTPPGKPAITYDIGEDGSVFKWKNAVTPPLFDDIAGTLEEFRETATPIGAGDHNLVVHAYSAEGIDSIELIANGNQLIDELHCEQDLEKEGTECTTLVNEWVTNTGNHPPGILNLEIIITDRLEQTASERLWVNIPEPPPPPAPGTPVPPTFAEILEFREEHGLDIDLDPVQDEMEINDRVFESINAWHTPDSPAGQIARASWERWGIPLRTPDVAELEYRIAYWEQASEVIPSWVGSNAPSSFAGFYLDERSGGKVVVGFVGEQAAASLAALEGATGLMVEPERVTAFPAPPSHTLVYLESLQSQISSKAATYPSGLIKSIRIDIEKNLISVGAYPVSQAQSLLQNDFGNQAPISVHHQLTFRKKKIGRERIEGKVRAGDEIISKYNEFPESGPCTASFGAFQIGEKPATGERVSRMFVLTAGHCVELSHPVYRKSNPNPTPNEKREIGTVKRSGYESKGDAVIDVDAAAIRLKNPELTPRQIFQDEGLPPIDVTSVWSPKWGTNLCFSGRTSREKRCGPVISLPEVVRYGNEIALEMCFEAYIWGGDSGSPVWVEGTGVAVGIAVTGYGGPDEPGLSPEEKAVEESAPKEACAVLLLPYQNRPLGGSVFGNSDLAPLHLVTKSNATNATP